MLQLKNITKEYTAGTTKVEALRGVDLEFRQNEFVSILGPSGCGKTTMLNLLGGLDRYTTGDIVINNKSTKDFTDRDWDTYRNRRIGFVFQSYNLIPHQTVLSNVELALTLSGVSRAERRQRAEEVLGQVGLSDQLHKKPTQMSGGQMQRVAIARALVNNPDILMADEPTGALDSTTSVQIMEILKEIAKDRLVIMVTHNSDLAERYSTRIIRLLDGQVTDDSSPYASEPQAPSGQKKKKRGKKTKTSMSFLTALSLSLTNLLTKKTRTFMTAFAGSIGIIGIALILSLSNGFQSYIDRMQEDTLSTYPLTIEESSTDLTNMMNAMQTLRQREDHPLDKIYSNDIMNKMIESMINQTDSNDLEAIKTHFDDNKAFLDTILNDIKYSYTTRLNLYAPDLEEEIKQINPFNLFGGSGGGGGGGMGGGMGMMGSTGMDIWSEILDNQTLLDIQYDVIAGRWPQEWNEAVMVVDEHNEIPDVALYALGLRDTSDMDEIRKAIISGEEYKAPEQTVLTYDEILGLSYLFVPSAAYYKKAGDGWLDMRDDEAYMRELLKNEAEPVRIVGIVRPAEGVEIASIMSIIGYTKALTEHIIEVTAGAEIVRAQMGDPDTDVFTGKPFTTEDDPETSFDISSLPEEQQAYLASLSEEERAALLDSYSETSSATYEGNMRRFGSVSLDMPTSISLYPIDFNAKEDLLTFIKDYNREKLDAGQEELTIHYTDLIGILLSSISTIINAISYVLIAFVSISLIVSSIMIGIITYVSVLERTKEIGILKAIGASRSDISRVFNAETLIVGFVAGALGILVSVLVCIPGNMIIYHVTSIANVAVLPWLGGVILVALSMILTLIAGLIPSRIAAKKDPVEALRSE